ncbi:MAG: nucleotidyl transferase AbiEii/AbiGii toxin family protein [Gammaproteobacteria bacterium]|nr:nucleotidyl transferase AbiEii/AbiGii toxin family protein [Gammaproteobacteria bacterium]
MIPRDYVLEWRRHAPWTENFQIEQDLVICRALVEIYSDPLLASKLAFRGGAALSKLYLTPAARYSEDIDLVQIEPGAAGPLMTHIWNVLRPWLGEAAWRQSQGRVTLVFRFLSEDVPAMRLRLKIEINSREHFAVLGLVRRCFTVDSRWYKGSADIVSFELDELLATKLRALYQRRKGRDLFDLAIGLSDERSDARRIASVFQHYMNREGRSVTRAIFEANLADKLNHPAFNADMNSLSRLDFEWRMDDAARRVTSELISLLPN